MNSKNYGKYKSIPYLLPIRCLIFTAAFVLTALFSKLTYAQISKWWTAVAIICNIITLAVLYLFCHKNELNYKSLINYEKGKTKFFWALLIVIIILAVGMCGLYLSGLICYGKFPYLDKTMVQPVPLWLAILVLVTLPLTTTLAEDGLYLGYALNVNKGNKWVKVILSAFFYALQHSFIPFIPDAIFIIYRLLSFLPLTIIICFWYQSYRNPLPFMTGHFVLNIATAVQILIMTIYPQLFDSI